MFLQRWMDTVGLISWRQTLGWLQKSPLLLKLTSRPTTELIGLDISPDFLKIIKMQCDDKPFQVENIAIIPLPNGVIVKDEIKDFSKVSEALRHVVNQAGFTSKDVAFAIPRSLAIIKYITIDSRLTKDEIESRAWIEASRHFPDLIDNVFLDFSVIGQASQDPSQLEVVLVACRKEHLEPYLEVIKLSGLNPRVVDLNSYALERALPLVMSLEEQNGITALLNLNTNLSTFIVIQSEKLMYAHDQPYDGQRLLMQVQAYCKSKNLDLACDASKLLSDPDYHAILQENLISHLRHAIHVFFTSKPNITINQIYLAGDCAVIPNIDNFITQEMGISAQVANPQMYLTLAPKINRDEFTNMAPSLMLCFGLALSRMD